MTDPTPTLRIGRLATAAAAALLFLGLPTAGNAQNIQRGSGPASQPGPQQPPPGAEPTTAPPQPAGATPRRWDSFAPMVLERVFRGPLQDTLVQRWRDPNDGAVCFVYLPISASVAGQGPYLIYGPNTIGSISCFAPAQVIQLQSVGATAAPSPPQSTPAPQAPRAR